MVGGIHHKFCQAILVVVTWEGGLFKEWYFLRGSLSWPLPWAVLPIDIYPVLEIFLRHLKDHRADLEFARGFGVTSLVDTTCVFSLSFGPTMFEPERGL